MKIWVIWTGYVWLIQATWLAKIGFSVTAIDIFQEKIDMLNKWIPTIYENWLEDLLKETYQNINFSTNISEISWSDIIFLCVWTPQDNQWKTNLEYIKQATKDLQKLMIGNEIIVIKSTVPVWTNKEISEILENKYPIVSNPEFLREWLAIEDFFNPDRIVLGFKNNEKQENIEKVIKTYSFFKEKNIEIVKTNWETAELIKYSANSFLATKISFINEISKIADKTWANIKDISKAIWLDPRIWDKFLNAWIGYGGSCFPKDVKSLIHQFKENNLNWKIIEAVDQVNLEQVEYFIEKILNKYNWNISGKTFWIAWIAFKPDTDDLRESRALVIIEKLLDAWAHLKVFDYNEKARENFEKYSYSLTTLIKNFIPIEVKDSFEKVTTNIDSLIIAIEDKRILDENFSKLELKDNVIFDWKNLLNKKEIEKNNIEYIWIWY